MIDAERPAPFLIADDRALDFLNSVASPWGSEIEWLRNGGDLLAWLDHAGLVPAAVLQRFRNEGKDLDAVATEARDLRECFVPLSANMPAGHSRLRS